MKCALFKKTHTHTQKGFIAKCLRESIVSRNGFFYIL